MIFSVFQKNRVFGYSWSTRKPRFPIPRHFWVSAFWMIFSVLQKNQILGYSWSTLLWHRCYYPHRLRDALSLVCGIFYIDLEYQMEQKCRVSKICNHAITQLGKIFENLRKMLINNRKIWGEKNGTNFMCVTIGQNLSSFLVFMSQFMHVSAKFFTQTILITQQNSLLENMQKCMAYYHIPVCW